MEELRWGIQAERVKSMVFINGLCQKDCCTQQAAFSGHKLDECLSLWCVCHVPWISLYCFPRFYLHLWWSILCHNRFNHFEQYNKTTNNWTVLKLNLQRICTEGLVFVAKEMDLNFGVWCKYLVVWGKDQGLGLFNIKRTVFVQDFPKRNAEKFRCVSLGFSNHSEWASRSDTKGLLKKWAPPPNLLSPLAISFTNITTSNKASSEKWGGGVLNTQGFFGALVHPLALSPASD